MTIWQQINFSLLSPFKVTKWWGEMKWIFFPSSLHISKHTFTNKNNALIEQENDEEKCFLLFLTTSEVFVFLHLSLWLHLVVGGPPSPYLPFNLSKPFHEIKLRLSHKILHQVKGRLNFFCFLLMNHPTSNAIEGRFWRGHDKSITSSKCKNHINL